MTSRADVHMMQKYIQALEQMISYVKREREHELTGVTTGAGVSGVTGGGVSGTFSVGKGVAGGVVAGGGVSGTTGGGVSGMAVDGGGDSGMPVDGGGVSGTPGVGKGVIGAAVSGRMTPGVGARVVFFPASTRLIAVSATMMMDFIWMSKVVSMLQCIDGNVV